MAQSRMSNPASERKVLEEFWLERLNDAKVRLDFVRNYVDEVRYDLSTGVIREDVEKFSNKSMRLQGFALEKYCRVLRIYTDLMAHGIIPDEADW